MCRFENVLLVPKLSFNILSVSKASKAGKTTKFDNSGCEIINKERKVIAYATRVGSLYRSEVCGSLDKLKRKDVKDNKVWDGELSQVGRGVGRNTCCVRPVIDTDSLSIHKKTTTQNSLI